MGVAFIAESSTPVAGRCRCGTDIQPGDKVLRVESITPVSEVLFRRQMFCSARCVRMFCLESMETLAALDTPSSASVVSDIHELYAGVAELFAETLETLS